MITAWKPSLVTLWLLLNFTCREIMLERTKKTLYMILLCSPCPLAGLVMLSWPCLDFFVFARLYPETGWEGWPAEPELPIVWHLVKESQINTLYWISTIEPVLLNQYYWISTTEAVLLNQYYWISTTESVLLNQYYWISTTESVLLNQYCYFEHSICWTDKWLQIHIY